MGLDSSQACINFCFGYSVFLEAHLQAIINSLECWQNIQTCRQAGDDTTLGKSSGSRPNSERGGGGRAECSRASWGKWLLFPSSPLSKPHHPHRPKGRQWAPEPPPADPLCALPPDLPGVRLCRRVEGGKGPEEVSSGSSPGLAQWQRVNLKNRLGHSLESRQRGDELTTGQICLDHPQSRAQRCQKQAAGPERPP